MSHEGAWDVRGVVLGARGALVLVARVVSVLVVYGCAEPVGAVGSSTSGGVMDAVTQALRDPTFAEELEEEPGLGGTFGGAPFRVRDGAPSERQEIPTIDLDLPPVDAAPRHKGPRQRLQELRASAKRVEAMTPLERDRVRRRARQWLGDL